MPDQITAEERALINDAVRSRPRKSYTFPPGAFTQPAKGEKGSWFKKAERVLVLPGQAIEDADIIMVPGMEAPAFDLKPLPHLRGRKRGGVKADEARHQQILDLHDQGKKVREIADLIPCSMDTVSRALSRAGKISKGTALAKQRERAVMPLAVKGLSLVEISKQTGIKEATVRAVICRLGLFNHWKQARGK